MTAAEWLSHEIHAVLDECYGISEDRKAEYLMAFACGQIFASRGIEKGVERICEITNDCSKWAKQNLV